MTQKNINSTMKNTNMKTTKSEDFELSFFNGETKR
jgi:hypothetical protein